ncbi:MAG: DMT family transporter [Cohaesibacter sp.]|jgi:drug/metabolite transporter (DMT)-like permease|nr:DMT family transporter [Cohaesibacter sp.]
MTTAPQGTAARREGNAVVGKGNLYGIFVMQLAMLMFVSNDMLNKIIGAALPVGQLTFARGIGTLIVVSIILYFTGSYRRFSEAKHWTVLLRSVLETAAALCFLTALAHIPIGNATAILLAISLTATAGAAIFFGEQVGIRRWSAILVGFIGVLVIVRPGFEGFNSFSLYAVLAMFLAALRDLVTRKIPEGTSVWVVTTTTLVFVTIGGALVSVNEVWVPISNLNLLFLAICALCLVFGHFFIVIAMQNGDIAVVSSFRYTSILIALVYGFLIWGDVPDFYTQIGILLVLGSGLYTIYRERVRARNAKKRH